MKQLGLRQGNSRGVLYCKPEYVNQQSEYRCGCSYTDTDTGTHTITPHNPCTHYTDTCTCKDCHTYTTYIECTDVPCSCRVIRIPTRGPAVHPCDCCLLPCSHMQAHKCLQVHTARCHAHMHRVTCTVHTMDTEVCRA